MKYKEIIDEKGYVIKIEFSNLNNVEDLQKAKDILDEYIALQTAK